MSFFKRLRDWAAGKYREKYLESRCVNLKCPHCNTWGSDCDQEPEFKSCDHPIAVQYNCGQCLKPSYWVCEAGFWFSAERFGINIEQDSSHD